MQQQAGSPGFGKLLAHTEKMVRDRAFMMLREYISEKGSALNDLDFLKLWKGLYYCYWMSDKPLIQQELANQLAETITVLNDDTVAIKYIASFWSILIKEWFMLDRLRLDKYFNLCRRFYYWSFKWLESRDWQIDLVVKLAAVYERLPLSTTPGLIPNALQYFSTEVYFEELANAMRSSDIRTLPPNVFSHLIEPFYKLLESCDNHLLVQRIISEVLMHWIPGNTVENLSDETDKVNVTEYLAACATPQEVLDRLKPIVSDKSTRRVTRKVVGGFARRIANTYRLEYERKPVKWYDISMDEPASVPGTPKLTGKKAKKAAKAKSKSKSNEDEEVRGLDDEVPMSQKARFVKAFYEDELAADLVPSIEAAIEMEVSSSSDHAAVAPSSKKRKNKRTADKMVHQPSSPASKDAEMTGDVSVASDATEASSEPSPKRAKKEKKKVTAAAEKEGNLVQAPKPVTKESQKITEPSSSSSKPSHTTKKEVSQTLEPATADVESPQKPTTPSKQLSKQKHQKQQPQDEDEAVVAQVSTLEESSERKSVRWGTKLRVKTFSHIKPICHPSELTSPEHKPATKSALRKTPAVFHSVEDPLLNPFVMAKKKSKRVMMQRN